MTVTRRGFAKSLGAAVGAGALGAPAVLRAQSEARVVVIGGGAGGGTVATDLAQAGQGRVDVTLVQDTPRYTTCFYNNLYLAGLRSFESITHGYDRMADRHGVKTLFDLAIEADTVAKRVKLAGGRVLAYDVLVMAPGIEVIYDAIAGYSEAAATVMPHGWTSGKQIQILKQRLDAIDDGGLFVIAAPPLPYRCPPGPYERASLVAHLFKQQKPRAKILILDAKETYPQQALFQEAWQTYYDGMIEWVPGDFGGRLDAVDPAAMTLTADGETYNAAGANVIPPQRAGAIARTAGLTDTTGWCPVDPTSMASRLASDVYVIGDACDPGAMPKSASAGHSQAKVAAAAIRHKLTGSPLSPAKLDNICWTTLAPDDVVKVGGTYAPADGKLVALDSFISEVGEPAEVRRQTRRAADAWYAAITADIFGPPAG